jgi:hypothetical protein
MKLAIGDTNDANRDPHLCLPGLALYSISAAFRVMTDGCKWRLRWIREDEWDRQRAVSKLVDHARSPQLPKDSTRFHGSLRYCYYDSSAL